MKEKTTTLEQKLEDIKHNSKYFILNKIKNEINLDGINLTDITDEINTSHENLEKKLVWQGFNILNIIYDYDKKNGDETGFVISLSKREDDDLYYIHIFSTSIYGEIKYEINHRLDESYEEVLNSTNNYVYLDFKTFEKLKDVGDWLNQLVDDLNICSLEADKDETEFYMEDVDSFMGYNKLKNKGWTKQYCSFLNVLYFSYVDNDFIDEYKIRKLAKHENINKGLIYKHQAYKNMLEVVYNQVEYLKYRINNIDYFKFDKDDIERIVKYLGNDITNYTSDYIVNNISKFDIERLLNGRSQAIKLYSTIYPYRISRTLESESLNNLEFPEINIDRRDIAIGVMNKDTKEFSGTTETIYRVVKYITLEDVLSSLYYSYIKDLETN